MTPLPYADAEGTTAFARRLGHLAGPGHFRTVGDLWVSSIGLGTYLGPADDSTDRLYEGAVERALELACNFIDTAVNYRFQRSERAIGRALTRLFREGAVARNQVVLGTKGGFIPYDGAPPRDARGYFRDTFVDRGVARVTDLVAGCHCMTPAYLHSQVDQSLANLQLDCIDIYYLHNPETQLQAVPRAEFQRRLTAAFEALERCAAEGKIRCYGTATWDGYRNPPHAIDYLSLSEVWEAARRAGGEAHHFRAIQLPLNVGMVEAIRHRNQRVDGEILTPLEAAARLGLTVVASASILQGRASGYLPDVVRKSLSVLETDAQRAIQFVRSTPGLTVALVGMKQPAHVEENLAVARVAPVDDDVYRTLLP